MAKKKKKKQPFKAFGERVLLKDIVEEEKGKKVLVLPDARAKFYQVVSVGEEVAFALAEGDVVVIAPHAQLLTMPQVGDEYCFVFYKDILAIVGKDEIK